MPITLDPQQGTLAKQAAEVAEVLEHAETEKQPAKLVDPHGHSVDLPAPLFEVLGVYRGSVAARERRGHDAGPQTTHEQ